MGIIFISENSFFNLGLAEYIKNIDYCNSIIVVAQGVHDVSKIKLALTKYITDSVEKIILISDVFHENIFHETIQLYILPTVASIGEIISLLKKTTVRVNYKKNFTLSEKIFLIRYHNIKSNLYFPSIVGMNMRKVSSYKCSIIKKIGVKNSIGLILVLMHTKDVHAFF